MKRRDFLVRGTTAAGAFALLGCVPRTPGAIETAGVSPLRLPTAGTTYYVRPAGSDENSGTSPDRAWRTIDRVNAQKLAPGDTVLFEGGSSFFGTIRPTRSGSSAHPITFRSFGWGRATIARGTDGAATHGCHLEDVSHITIQDLDFDGGDRADGEASGVRAYALDAPMRGITVRGCDITNYGWCGIECGSSAAERFSDLTIERVGVSRCRGAAGIYLTNKSPAEERDFTMFRDVVIRDCRVRDVVGDGWGWTGSGITVFWTAGLLIEYCEVSETGLGSGTSGGGPVGIWVSSVADAVIQRCESHHNRSNGTFDGGGFDLDGGSQNCVIQYCYSHDNEGAGYVINYFQGGPETFGNVIRFNISENDGNEATAPGAGFALWNEGNVPERLRDTQILCNTVHAAHAGSGTPLVRFSSETRDSTVRNNIFVASHGGPLVAAMRPAPGAMFQGNLYHATRGRFIIRWIEETYHGLNSWRRAAGQERLGKQDVGVEADPLLIDSGHAGTVGSPRRLPHMLAYRLSSKSPAVRAGVNLHALEVDMGEQDFFGMPLPADGEYRVAGAALATLKPGKARAVSTDR